MEPEMLPDNCKVYPKFLTFIGTEMPVIHSGNLSLEFRVEALKLDKDLVLNSSQMSQFFNPK